MIKDYTMKNKQILKKHTNKTVISVTTFLLYALVSILLPGCAKYKVQHVCQKEEILCSFEEHKASIDLTVRAFDPQEEFKNYLSDYQPLALHIKNKTAHQQELAVKNISLAVETLKNLKKKEPKLFFVNFIPCILASVLGFLFWWEFVLPSMLVLGACGGQLSIKQYERASKLLKKNCCFPHDTLTIKPYSSVDTLIFVKKTDYKPRFTVTLQESATNTATAVATTTFNVFITARTVNAYSVR